MNLYSVEGFRLALTHLQTCLELAPDYVPALADSSVTYTLLGYYGAMPDDVVWPRARSLADRAIALDPKLAEAWSARGLEAGFHRWSWNEAKAACERAIELNPASALAHSQYALAYLLPVGRVDDAIRQFELAISLDPLFSVAQYVLGFSYLSAGRFEDAVRQYVRTIELGSPHPDVYWDYGMALGYLGRHGEARKAFEKKRFLSGERPEEIGGLEAWFSGDFERARADAPAAERAGRQGREDAIDIARYFAVNGNAEKAVEWLEVGLERRERQMLWVLVDPRLKAIRSEERYKAVARKMGLLK
jgi:tetratricopeptide (TPR) repeat protein